MSKTHWLQSPNKNYLGHQDLPNWDDIVVTIKSAKWEEVTNPILNTKEAKRVVRFKEKGIKPFICNQTNAGTIIKVTGVKFMEDTKDKKLQFFIAQTKVKGSLVDCLRIRDQAPKDLEELDTKHPKWSSAVSAVKEGKDIDSFKKWYSITEENKSLLLKESKDG